MFPLRHLFLVLFVGLRRKHLKIQKECRVSRCRLIAPRYDVAELTYEHHINFSILQVGVKFLISISAPFRENVARNYWKGKSIYKRSFGENFSAAEAGEFA